MSYPDGHRRQTRGRIIDSARRLFNGRGFESVSIDQIMGEAGLTRGGFYTYFRSKSDLYAEVLGCFFTDPNWKSRWEGVEVDMTASDAGAQIVRAYLSRTHFDDVENSCPMVALPCDAARGGARTRQAFEEAFQAMVKVLGHSMTGSRTKREASARAVAALCIGGMVVARAMDNVRHADRLRADCMEYAMEVGGWQKPPVSTEISGRGKTILRGR